MVDTRKAGGAGSAARDGRKVSVGSSSRKRAAAKAMRQSRSTPSGDSPNGQGSTKNAAKSLRKGKKPLATMTESALQEYFRKLNGTTPGDLYDLVLSEVERPLFRTVMEYTDGNQSRAAEILGINRGTLRKKLKTYSISVQ